MKQKSCANCGKQVKDSLFSGSKQLGVGKGTITFCSGTCRERYKRERGIRTYDHRP